MIVRNLAAMLALSLLGCSHLVRSHLESSADPLVVDVTYPGDLVRVDAAVSSIDAVWVGGVPAVESVTSAPVEEPLCHDDDTNPPHVCPGTTPAPASPPSEPQPSRPLSDSRSARLGPELRTRSSARAQVRSHGYRRSPSSSATRARSSGSS
jgi:hypothetical protein